MADVSVHEESCSTNFAKNCSICLKKLTGQMTCVKCNECFHIYCIIKSAGFKIVGKNELICSKCNVHDADVSDDEKVSLLMKNNVLLNILLLELIEKNDLLREKIAHFEGKLQKAKNRSEIAEIPQIPTCFDVFCPALPVIRHDLTKAQVHHGASPKAAKTTSIDESKIIKFDQTKNIDLYLNSVNIASENITSIEQSNPSKEISKHKQDPKKYSSKTNKNHNEITLTQVNSAVNTALVHLQNNQKRSPRFEGVPISNPSNYHPDKSASLQGVAA